MSGYWPPGDLGDDPDGDLEELTGLMDLVEMAENEGLDVEITQDGDGFIVNATPRETPEENR